jgi:pyruvate/2-oxoglutarate dehydrogenase complex dihydrolipoamide acyltransferase (E2) component
MSLTYILVDFDNVKPSAADIGLAHGDKYRLAVVRGPQQTRYEADLAEALHAMGNQVTFTRCAKAGKNAADMQIAFHLGELLATLPAVAHKHTRFVVISRDRDFDPLLMYLQAKGFDATRAASFKAALGGKEAEPRTRATRTRAAKAAPAPVAAKAAPAKAPATRKSVAKKAPAPRKAALVQPAAKKAVHAAARTPSKKAAPDPIARIIEGLQRKGDERPGKRKGLERFVESHLGRNLAPGQIEALLAQLERDGVLVFKDNKVDYLLPKDKK